MFLILGILGWGILIGGAAQLILRGDKGTGVDWGLAIVAGIAGSFVGGMLFSLIAGDGLNFRASGVIGSLLGAMIITVIWQMIGRRKLAKQQAAAKAKQRSGRHH